MNPQTKKDQFTQVIEQNKGIIYKVAKVYGKNQEDREDIFQEITVQLWSAFDRYDNKHKLSTWMYRIALNVAISFYRKERRRSERYIHLPENFEEIADDRQPVESEASILLLYQFIGELKELDKALMILSLESRSYREIAGILGITETNVATKVGRIKGQLKQKFLTNKS